jgi:hypothetical protein
MDTVVWLVQTGADPDAITWVVPRDSWLINRVTTQPAPEFFDEVIGGQADQMAAFAAATSTDDLFLRLEACGAVTRVDRDRTPRMFHLATVAPGEVEVLRRIRDVVRLGRVRALEPGRMVLDDGEVPVAPGTLFVDCTASAVRPRPLQPVFQGDRIVLQMLRLPQPAFSSALTAWVEAHHDDEEQQNRLCAPVRFPHTLDEYAGAVMTTMLNQFSWSQDRELRRWIRTSRLDGFGKLVSGVDRDDAHRQAVLARYRDRAMAAVGNMSALTGAAAGDRAG